MLDTKRDGGPVLPEVQRVKRPNSNKHRLQRIPGMRLRDYFAAEALSALIVGRTWDHLSGDAVKMFSTWANSAYGLADIMLDARDGEGTLREDLNAARSGWEQATEAVREAGKVREQLVAALCVIKTQSIGPDWTAEQAIAFIKQHAGEALAAAEA